VEQLQPLQGEDWSQPDPLSDDRAPRIISVTPADGSTDAPASTKITATFDEATTGSVIEVKDSAGASVPGAVEADAGGKTVTFTPSKALKPGVTYTAEVREARDGSFNRIDEYPWSFTISGLAAHWKFDEGGDGTAADSSGKGHDAKLNETASWTTGKIGGALTNTLPTSTPTATPTSIPTSTATPTPTATPTGSAGPSAPLRKPASLSGVKALAVAPTVTGFGVAPSQVVNGAIVTSSLTPALKATVTDAAAGASTVEFRVMRYIDDIQVWSGSVANVASSTQASITVPAAKLTDGTKYEWRVKATASGATSGWTPYQFFTADVPEAVVDQFQVTPSSMVGTDIVTPSLTPALRARVTDPLGGPATVAFEVARYSDDVVVWSGSVANVASGAEASVTVPVAKLTDGTKYEWRVKATTPGSTPAWSAYRFFTVNVPEAVVDQFQVAPSETVDTSTVTTSLTPTLMARVTDPLGSPATVDFQVADWATDT
ncbi:Ig-like domain-containing protein, partial [Streptomyces anulatus]|uniref:Ig-like domain-containing protein n=1 Tax=Streptomyces anulatus TaxID=1892 RepID=UPI00341721B1